VHSAKGMEWDTVYLLNVVDGSFPSEFAAGSAEQLEEERRLFYVALTRARNDLLLYAPLKFYVTGQHRYGDAHVYGGRSRFLSAAVLAHLDRETPAALSPGTAGDAAVGLGPALDVGARLRQMW
jgi:DNA helicase-2/ATP-dependent DNA helicase PcrA